MSQLLRPLEAVPFLLSDREIREALLARYRGQRHQGDVRAARVLAFVLQLRHLLGADEGWRTEFPVDGGEIASSTGVARARIRPALDMLVRTGCLERIQGTEPRYRFGSHVFERSAAADHLDWQRLWERMPPQAAALLVLRSLLDLLRPPYTVPQAVSLGEMAEASGYAQFAVREALRELERLELIVREQVPGREQRVALSPALVHAWASDAPQARQPAIHRADAALPIIPIAGATSRSGLTVDAAPAESSPVLVRPVAMSQVSSPQPEPAATRYQVSINGVPVLVLQDRPLELPPGHPAPRLEFDAKGRPVLLIGSEVRIEPM